MMNMPRQPKANIKPVSSGGASAEASAAPEATERRLYLLESLSVVKSPLILTEMQQGSGAHAQGAERCLVQLFDVLFAGMRSDTGKAAEAHAGDIVCSCLEEMTTVLPSTLLEVLLARLLDRVRAPRAFGLATAIICRLAEALAEPVAHYLKAALEGRGCGAEEGAGALGAQPCPLGQPMACAAARQAGAAAGRLLLLPWAWVQQQA